MEVRYMSDDAIKAMFYIQLEDMKFKTVIEILQMNAFYSYCFPESHLKELRKIEGKNVFYFLVVTPCTYNRANRVSTIVHSKNKRGAESIAETIRTDT